MPHRILIIAVLALWTGNLTFADVPKLRLGVILPLTGKAATVGVALRNGMMMAYEGLPLSTKANLGLHFEDDASESTRAVSAAQRLLSDGSVDLLFTALSNTGNAVVPITEKKQIPLLSFAYDRGISDQKKYAFTFWVDVSDLAAAAVDEASRRGFKNIALVTTEHEGNIAMRDKLMKTAANRLQFPVSEEVQLTDTDLASHVLRLKTAGAVDGVALLMHAGHCGLFAKSLRANGVKLPVFTLGNFEDKNIRVSSDGALEGQWYSSTTYSPWFLSAYQQKYPGDSTFGAAFGHDSILLLAQAAEKLLKREELAPFLRVAQIAGGAVPEVKADGRNGFQFPVSIKVVGHDGVDDGAKNAD